MSLSLRCLPNGQQPHRGISSEAESYERGVVSPPYRQFMTGTGCETLEPEFIHCVSLWETLQEETQQKRQGQRVESQGNSLLKLQYLGAM